MTNIAKNIKTARIAANMTQEELAQKLIITRQAVSNWENGKTEPDLELISSIASALGITGEELIYGKKPKAEVRDIKVYKKCARISGIIAAFCLLICIISKILVVTFPLEFYYTYRHSLVTALGTSTVFVFKPIFIASFALFILSLISISKDIHIKNAVIRKASLFIGIVLALVLAAPALSTFVSIIASLLSESGQGTKIFLFKFILMNSKFPFLSLTYAIPAVLIYFGIIKK